MDDNHKESKSEDVEYEYSDDSENGSGTDSHGDESQTISDMLGGGSETIFGDILQNNDSCW